MNTTAMAQPSASYVDEFARIGAIEAALGQQRLSTSPLARCIGPLMVALDWFGAPRSLLSSLPGEEQPIGLADLQEMLADHGFRSHVRPWRQWLQQGGLDVLPAGSVVLAGGKALIYLGRIDGSDCWHDGSALSQGPAPADAKDVLLIQRNPDHRPLDAPQVGWFGRLMFTARREIGGVLFVSLIANLLALVISLFTMFVYNTIIPSGAVGSLWAMTVGALIAIVGAWGLRLARIRVVSRMTGWAGAKISDTAMRKTLGLPAEVSSRLGVENNLIRMRSIEGVRQWFGGGGGTVNADYPFVIIFLIVIALLGGWIVVVPMVGLLLYALLAWPLASAVQARSSEVGRVSRKLGEMTAVVTKRLRALRGVRGSALWNRHLSELVAQSVAANRDYALVNGLTQTVGQALSMLTVLATMGVGIALVLAGDMSTGGLIATMMLIWRITTPAQQMFASQVRIRNLMDAGRQLDRLLASAGEVSNPQIVSPVASLFPAIEADRLYFRYSADREPALSGVSFKVEPGQILAVVGPNGAGKTTLLEILAGLRLPQNGRVKLDGRDIRQFDPADYRSWHGYLPQQIPGLPVNLRQALTLRHQTSSDAEMASALARVAGDEWWRYFGKDSLEEGLGITITPWREDRDAVRGRYIVRMAATIMGNPPLILLDDPLGDRDPALDAHFLRLLDSLRGRSTVIMTTHRPDLIQRSDLIAVLDDGNLAHFGPVATPSEESSAAQPAQA